MALNRTAIENAIRQAVMDGSGLADERVYFANDKGTQPKKPFITINPNVATAPVGMFDEERLTETPGEILRVGHRRVTVSVNVYGEGAVGLAERVGEWLERYDVNEAFEDVGIALQGRAQVRDMARLLDTHHEPRAQFDFTLAAVGSSSELVGWIETIELTGTIHGAPDAASDPLTITRTIT